MKSKMLIITCVVCLFPVLFGVVVWDKLPYSMAIHFDVYNNPDNFASKTLVVFGLPLLMCLLQIVSYVTSDIQRKKYSSYEKIEMFAKWIIPVMTVILQIITLGYNLGYNIDIRKIAIFLVGSMMILTGNFLPKLDYVKNFDIDTDKAIKINKFVGIETVIMGVLFIISIFFKPLTTTFILLMLIPYSIIALVYSMIIIKKR